MVKRHHLLLVKLVNFSIKFMKIVHIVDYLMPTMGYQEFILPKFNAMNNNVDVYILTGNKYYPIPNYENTWKKFLGNRNFKPKNEIINKVKIIRDKILFEIEKRPWISNLEINLKNIKPDIIMCHGTTSFSSIRSVFLAKKMNIPIFLDNHMVFSIAKKNLFGKFYYFILRKFFSKFIENNSNIIFGVTKETCKYLIDMEGYSKKKIKLLPLGTDSSIFFPKKKFNKKKNIIIQTGKLNPDKRPDLLARAVIILLEQGFNLKLIYYGSGEKNLIQIIKDLFRKKGLISNLQFKNFQSYQKLGNIYNSADVVVFPFGTSLSSIDSAFCGTPVVMTNDIASKEKQKDGIGICYKTGDVNDLVKKIKKCLYTKKKKRIRQNKKKLEKLKQKYDYKVISDRFLTLCKKEINKNIQINN